MNFKYLVLLLVAGGSILAVAWFAGRTDEPDPGDGEAASETIWSVPIQEQAVYERTLRPTLDRDEFLGFQDTLDLEIPNGLFLNAGDVFVFDYGPMQVHRFGGNGQLKASYGSGKGRNPGELMHLTDIGARSQEGQIIIADAMGQTLSFFEEDGTYVRRLAFSNQYSRVLDLGEDLVLMSSGAHLFHHYDHAGHLLHTHGSLVEDQSAHALNTSGRLLKSATSGFIYLPIDGGYIFYLDDSGATRRIIRTIDGWEFPFLGDTFDAQARLSEGAEQSRAYPSYVDREAERIYVTVAHVNRQNEWIAGFLDAYDWHTGEYLESWRLPFATHGAGMIDAGIVAVRSKSIVVIPLT